MHTLNRFLTLLLSVLVLVPPATFALVTVDTRDATQQSLDDAINSAVHAYQERSAYQSLLLKSQSAQTDLVTKVATLAAAERDLRQQIVVQKGIIDYVSKQYHVTLTDKSTVALLIDVEKKRLMRLVRERYVNSVLTPDASAKSVIVQTVLQAAAGSDATDAASNELTQLRFLGDLVDAQNAMQKIPVLLHQRDLTLAAYNDADRAYEDAVTTAQVSGDVLTQIQQITQDVHDQVLKVQGQLARIDAQLKSKAERALIEKGLLDPTTLQHGTLQSAAPDFHWPAYGPVSAGFLDADYKKHFGVPHLGMDIVVPQSSPVYAAADGIVFLVRDGGATGYSYILIGHQDGYATLYGHVSKALVQAGQEITAGEQIALSGGTPGMHGSGPMTTAAHLHFEVIRGGVNINPRSVLP
jgi:murein DD-endopeptidase MepM/ murein hydrolase activator NlpD